MFSNFCFNENLHDKNFEFQWHGIFLLMLLVQLSTESVWQGSQYVHAFMTSVSGATFYTHVHIFRDA